VDLVASDSVACSKVPMTRLQKTVARRMSAAKSEIPDFVVDVDVDMSAIAALRERCKSEGGVAPSYNDYVVKACALALREVPRVNASIGDGEFIFHERVNVGVAVATDGGLIVPVVRDADGLPIEQLAQTIRELAGKVRDGSITPAELTGGTFTVSNLGMFGVQRFTAVVNSPQAAILAAGAVQERVVAVAGRPEVRLRMTASLSADHRIIYGADAAQFLAAFRAVLEDPHRLER
jgi:pyruvate dehydrogenase E2 component (dihydrolipoamide acetyltransferase)